MSPRGGEFLSRGIFFLIAAGRTVDFVLRLTPKWSLNSSLLTLPHNARNIWQSSLVTSSSNVLMPVTFDTPIILHVLKSQERSDRLNSNGIVVVRHNGSVSRRNWELWDQCLSVNQRQKPSTSPKLSKAKADSNHAQWLGRTCYIWASNRITTIHMSLCVVIHLEKGPLELSKIYGIADTLVVVW